MNAARIDITITERHCQFPGSDEWPATPEQLQWWEETGQHSSFLHFSLLCDGKMKRIESPRFRRDDPGARRSALVLGIDVIKQVLLKTLPA